MFEDAQAREYNLTYYSSEDRVKEALDRAVASDMLVILRSNKYLINAGSVIGKRILARRALAKAQAGLVGAEMDEEVVY